MNGIRISQKIKNNKRIKNTKDNIKSKVNKASGF